MKFLVLLLAVAYGFNIAEIGLTDIYENNWSATVNHSGNIKDQKSTAMCWAFSATSFLEAHYNILTNNRMRLSVEQIGDNYNNYFDNLSFGDYARTNNPSFWVTRMCPHIWSCFGYL